jgi:hypothetical protein
LRLLLGHHPDKSVYVARLINGLNFPGVIRASYVFAYASIDRTSAHAFRFPERIKDGVDMAPSLA